MLKEFVQENKYWFETAGILLIFIVWLSRGQIFSAYGIVGLCACLIIALAAHFYAVRSRLNTLKETHPELFAVFEARKARKLAEEELKAHEHT